MIDELEGDLDLLDPLDNKHNYTILNQIVEKWGSNDIFKEQMNKLKIISASDFVGVFHDSSEDGDYTVRMNPDYWYYIDEDQLVTPLNFTVINQLIKFVISTLKK